MLDYIDHLTSKLLEMNIWGGNVQILPSFTQRYNRRHYVTLQFCKPLVVY